MSEARDKLRASLLSSKTVTSIPVVFFGEKIELRQPRLEDVLAVQNNEDREVAVIETLINYAYVPGTEERVFEDGDKDTLKKMPFGADFIRVSQALETLTEVNFLDKSDTSKGDPTST